MTLSRRAWRRLISLARPTYLEVNQVSPWQIQSRLALKPAEAGRCAAFN
jgi:hypothetical protein